jgi:UPF0755 protein
MDENKQVGAVNPSENPTFDQLTMDEKRRLIAALSMGRLNEEEKREFADMVRRSQLIENERAQISRAFAMSCMTDEERRALLARRQQEKSVGTAAEAQAQTASPTPAPPAPDTDAEEPKQTVSPNAAIHDSEEERTRAHTVMNEDTASHRRDTAGLTRSVTVPVTRVLHDSTQKGTPAGKKKPRHADEAPVERDTTAITSLLKGIVYIVAVLVISVFASWTIIEVANDVFAFAKSDEAVTVVIEEEMTANDVAQMLYENGIIKYPTMYELFIRLKEESTDYLVGEYEISPSMNYGDINDTFTYIAHTREQVVVTIPEGYTVDQIIDLLLKNGIGTREGFVAAINEFDYGYRFMQGLDDLDPERTYRLEGYLFPDTYYFFKDASEVAVIDKFLVNFERKVSEEYYERADVLGMSMDDLIILASMIQAEGMTLSDFENISSVFHNRLANPRSYPKMQSDATLQYILDKRKTALTASDLQIDSKYNSYKYNGLPPGSICNPGMDAINCALYPAETGYYYFLADGRGNTYFSETLEQHEALKAKYIDNQ